MEFHHIRRPQPTPKPPRGASCGLESDSVRRPPPKRGRHGLRLDHKRTCGRSVQWGGAKWQAQVERWAGGGEHPPVVCERTRGGVQGASHGLPRKSEPLCSDIFDRRRPVIPRTPTQFVNPKSQIPNFKFQISSDVFGAALCATQITCGWGLGVGGNAGLEAELFVCSPPRPQFRNRR